MSEFYERLKNFRNQSYTKINNSQGENRDQLSKDFELTKDVLNQLMKLAFYNESKPDSLPDVFFIHNVHFAIKDFEELMKNIGYDVEVDMVSRSFISGIASFKVTII